jgi:hypothetical protein
MDQKLVFLVKKSVLEGKVEEEAVLQHICEQHEEYKRKHKVRRVCVNQSSDAAAVFPAGYTKKLYSRGAANHGAEYNVSVYA